MRVPAGHAPRQRGSTKRPRARGEEEKEPRGHRCQRREIVEEGSRCIDIRRGGKVTPPVADLLYRLVKTLSANVTP